MDLSKASSRLGFFACTVAGVTCYVCIQGALKWTRLNRPQYLFFVRHGNSRPSTHPHEAKIRHLRDCFDLQGLREVLQCEKPEAHSSLKDMDFTWVGRKRELQALSQLLNSCKVFAVDIEAHSVFSYQSMPCLLQIAVGGRCFVVDLLALHDCMSILKAPFEDASILKLFHGCLADLQWLQQLDIYTVNVLDTCALAEEAVRVGRVKKPGLGHVLKQLCGVDSNKSIAIGDWRKRPLPEEMMFYSVSDVNYLQFIAMTLVEFSMQDVIAPVAAEGHCADAHQASQASNVASAEQSQEQAETAGISAPPGEADGACELHQLECGAEKQNRVVEGTCQPAVVSACALEEALDGGTPSSLVQRIDSVVESSGSTSLQQHRSTSMTVPSVSDAPIDGSGALDLESSEAQGDQRLQQDLAEAASTATATASNAADSATKQRKHGKKDGKKKENKAGADGVIQPAQPMDLARVWCKCCDRTLVLHREATVAEVANASMTRLVNKEVEYRRKGALQASKGHRGQQAVTEAAMFRIVAVLCYWRTAVAHWVNISPVIVLPDSLVGYVLKHRPRDTLGVVRCLLHWVKSHRQKHAERFLREAQAAAAAAKAKGAGVSTDASTREKSNGKRWASEDKNPFAWHLDHWSPGFATLLMSPWLAWLLQYAYSGRTSQLPVQVERMIAQQEVKHQPRGGAPTAASNNTASRKSQATSSGTPHTANGAQSAKGASAAGTDAVKSARTPEMVRDRVISKFSKKKPAYSSCRMLSQDGGFLAACDLKKLKWYVAKGLAQWEEGKGPGSPQPTIRLLFQHRTTDQASDNGFYNEVKANECVGCGEGGHYLKYKIVPDCYRKHFPVNMKSHRSHDIVLLCIDCHEKAHTSAETLKRLIAAVNSIPLQPASTHIRSDPFLPTPPPEECCSSREGDGEVGTDAASDASDGDYYSTSNVEAAASAVTTIVSAVAAASHSNGSIPYAAHSSAAVPSDAHGGAISAPSATRAAPAEPPGRRLSTATPAALCKGDDVGGASVCDSVELTGEHSSIRVEPAGALGADAVVAGSAVSSEAQQMPSPAHIRRVALTLERQPHLPAERRQAMEAVVARYVHGPAAAIDQGLAPGDLEAALLAGLAKTKRNQTIARLLQAGRPPPSGYVLSQQDGRVSVVSAPHHQGGHMWHGGKVVERVLAAYGTAGLQELQVEFRKRFVAAVQPKNLPASWRVHHEAPREFGTHSIFSGHPLASTLDGPPSTDRRPPQIFETPQEPTQDSAS